MKVGHNPVVDRFEVSFQGYLGQGSMGDRATPSSLGLSWPLTTNHERIPKVGGYFSPSEKYDRQIGANFPKDSG